MSSMSGNGRTLADRHRRRRNKNWSPPQKVKEAFEGTQLVLWCRGKTAQVVSRELTICHMEQSGETEGSKDTDKRQSVSFDLQPVESLTACKQV